MKKNATLVGSLLLFCMVCPPVLADDVVTVGMEVGQRYPDILLPDLDGGFSKVSDYRGKKVLLVHFASW